MWRVSRRALLKGVAATGMAAYGGGGIGGCREVKPTVGQRPVESQALHFDLSWLPRDLPLTLDVGATSYRLSPHDDDSRAAFLGQNPRLATAFGDRVSHHVSEVAFPADAMQSWLISHDGDAPGLRSLALSGLHIPQTAINAARRIKGDDFAFLKHRRLQLGGPVIDGADAGADGGDAGGAGVNERDLAQIRDPFDCARFLVFHHPDILAVDPVVGALLLHHVDGMARPRASDGTAQDPLTALADKIASLGRAASPTDRIGRSAWARGQYVLDAKGDRFVVTDEKEQVLLGPDGKPLEQWQYVPKPEVMELVTTVAERALDAIRDDDALESKKFVTSGARATRGEPLPDAPVSLGAPAAGPDVYAWSSLSERWDCGQLVSDLRPTPGSREISVTVSNRYNRHLGVYVAFLDDRNDPVRRSQLNDPDGQKWGAWSWDTEYCRFIDLVDPPTLFFGIPGAGKTTESVSFRVTIPPGISRLAVLTSALAFTNGDLRTPYLGIDDVAKWSTVVFEYGIPTLILAYGALFEGDWTTALKELRIPIGVTLAKIGARAKGAADQKTAADYTSIGVALATSVVKIGLAAGGTFAARWLGAITAGQVARGIPILGMAIFLADVADAAQSMTRTSIDLGRSKRCIQTGITSTNAIKITLAPEDAFGFPRTAKTWRFVVTPRGGDTLAPATGSIDPIAAAASFDVRMSGVPTGSLLRWRCDLLSDGGSVVGHAEGSFENVVVAPATEATSTGKIENQRIPIGPSTRYVPAERLVVSASGAMHEWVADATTPTPGRPLACAGGIDALCEPLAITVHGKLAQVGYAWRAADAGLPICDTATANTEAYALQNVNRNVYFDDGRPDVTLKAMGCGLPRPVLPVYDGSTNGIAASYVLEASTGVYALREVGLGPTSPADFRNAPVRGVFNSPELRAAALHWRGVVMAIPRGANKLEVLDIPTSPFGPGFPPARAIAPSGPGKRPGNVIDPVAVCAVPNADLFLVLENGNKRVQAFGLGGEPHLTWFPNAGAGGRSPFLPLAADRTYLDVSADIVHGLVYVLSRAGEDGGAATFFLDIYDREKGLVASSPGFVASRIALDPHQNVFSLGWSSMTFKNRKEPEVWLWTPKS